MGHLTATADAERDPRWHAVAARDPAADGRFVFSVATTGIYCRPSCPSRRANPRNVRFHADAATAEAAGFRACLRCRPAGPALAERRAALIAAACRRIAEAEETMPPAALARAAGLSPGEFHRLFKQVTGLTPGGYARGLRAERLRASLAPGRTVTEAIYEAGFNASSRFYESADTTLGMTATAYRAGGEAATIRVALGECTLGAILVASTARGVCAILLGDDAAGLLRELQHRFPRASLRGGDPGYEALVARVVALVEEPGRAADGAAALPLDLRGTLFQQRVWQALRAIPPGQTASYAEIARRIGQPKAARAVGAACAANAHAVAVPCHRVVRGDGDASGYRWGVARKRALLARERGDGPG